MNRQQHGNGKVVEAGIVDASHVGTLGHISSLAIFKLHQKLAPESLSPGSHGLTDTELDPAVVIVLWEICCQILYTCVHH